ncbi:MAG: ABC transporter permease, partial [Vulcanimicrobiaceae bacterium]
MSELLRALVLGPARAERLRATVTVVAVALGVALSLAIRLANATAVASFAHSVDVIANRVNVQILGVDRGFDERVFPRLATLPGVEQASPAIEDSLAAGVRKGAPFSGEILRVLGLDLIAAPADGLASQGALPQGLAASAQRLDPRVLIAGDGALVSAAVARRFRLHVGSRFPVLVGDRPAHLQIAGILPPGLPGIDSSVVFVDVSTAQELFHKVGRLDRIDLIVAPQHFARTLAAIRAILPPGARALEPRVRTSEIRRMLQSFQLNLAALADVALLVGMFLIYNAVAISVVQRRDAIGTARALGATRAEILRTFLTEGALYGLFGSLLGLLLGAFLARVCVTAVVGTVSELYVGTHADGVAFEPSIFAESFALGVALSILSALVPAREAARTPPALAMRSHGFEGPRARPGIGLALAGCGLLLVAAALARLPAQHGVPVFGYAAGLAIIFGIALVVPLLIRLASGGLRRAAGGRAPLA